MVECDKGNVRAFLYDGSLFSVYSYTHTFLRLYVRALGEYASQFVVNSQECEKHTLILIGK